MDYRQFAIGIILVLIGIGSLIAYSYAYEGSQDDDNPLQAGMKGLSTFLLICGILLIALGCILIYLGIRN